MFDNEHRHYHAGSTTNVNIKQQPNDAADAARLYGELQAKAQRDVASATIENLGSHNEVKFLKINSAQDPLHGTTKVRIAFTVNGKLYDLVVENEPDYIRERVYGALMEQVFDQCVKALHHIEVQSLHR